MTGFMYEWAGGRVRGSARRPLARASPSTLHALTSNPKLGPSFPLAQGVALEKEMERERERGMEREREKAKSHLIFQLE